MDKKDKLQYLIDNDGLKGPKLSMAKTQISSSDLATSIEREERMIAISAASLAQAQSANAIARSANTTARIAIIIATIIAGIEIIDKLDKIKSIVDSLFS